MNIDVRARTINFKICYFGSTIALTNTNLKVISAGVPRADVVRIVRLPNTGAREGTVFAEIRWPLAMPAEYKGFTAHLHIIDAPTDPLSIYDRNVLFRGAEAAVFCVSGDKALDSKNRTLFAELCRTAEAERAGHSLKGIFWQFTVPKKDPKVLVALRQCVGFSGDLEFISVGKSPNEKIVQQTFAAVIKSIESALAPSKPATPTKPKAVTQSKAAPKIAKKKKISKKA